MVKWLSKWFGYLWCAAALLAIASIECDPRAFGYFSLLGTGVLWFLLGCAVVACWWRKSWRALVPLGCIVIGWGHVANFVGLNFFVETAKTPTVRLVTWNLGQLWRWAEKPEAIAARQARFFEYLNQEARPDILCIQEIGGEFLKRIALETGLTYWATSSVKQTTVFSRYPIVATGELEFENTPNSCIWADIVLPDGKKRRVFSAHLQSNRVSQAADQVAQKGDIKQRETWDEVGNIFQKVNRATKKRVRQAEILADAVDRSPSPCIVMGDLNDTPHSFVYQILMRRLRDPFSALALGIGTTYKGSIPALRIDYALLSPKLKAVDYATLHPSGGLGDHWPVFCELSL